MRKREERAKRIYGILLSMGMLLTLLSVPVWAAEPLHENEAGEETEPETQIVILSNEASLAATQYTYTLHYEANGGSGAPPDQTVISTERYVSILVSNIVPIREGYIFEGWGTSAASSYVVYRAGDYATVVQGRNNTATIYAIWKVDEKTKYTVTYTDGVDDSEIFPDQQYTVEENADTPSFNGTPARTGYTFEGWDPEVAGKVTGNVTYTAKWSPKQYTVRMINNFCGLADETKVQTFIYDKEQALLKNDWVPEGGTFVSWNTKRDGTGTSCSDGQIVKNLAEEGHVELYAQWEYDRYQVNLDAKGGTIAEGRSITERTYGTGVILPTADEITRMNHTFAGWYENEDYSGNPVKEIDKFDVGNKTFYAKWKSKLESEYTAIFRIVEVSDDYEDGYLITDHSATFNLSCVLASAWAPSFDEVAGKAGYTMKPEWSFAGYGWYQDKPYYSNYPVNGSLWAVLGDIRNSSPPSVSTSEGTNIKLAYSGVTVWGLVKDRRPSASYTLSYDANGGADAPAAESHTNKNGSADFIVSSTIPKRAGYVFMGWADSPNADTAVYKANDSIRLYKNGNAEKTIYAVWKENTAPVPPGETKHNDANHDHTNHDNTGDTKESGSTPPAQLIAGDNAKTIRKDNGKSLIGAYEPGSSDTQKDTEDQSTEDKTMEDRGTEDQVTADQVTGDQRTEDTGDDQKSTAENNPADNNPAVNDSKPDDSTNLSSEDSSHSGGWIPVVCICAGALVIGLGLHLGVWKWKKTDRK